MLDEYIYSGEKKMRCGYTTGSCAAAAAKASAQMLLTGEKTETAELITPKGIRLELEILYPEITENSAVCAVKKDSGDDPDVTNGMLIFAEVSRIPSGVRITGGKGIGRVTRPGLDRPPGEFAINTVPRKMITAAVEEIAERYDYRDGFEVVISAPRGEEIAKKTYNPRMGIEGGISIIGTTGIVEPMSNSALIETIRIEEKMRKAEGCKSLLLTLGNYSRGFVGDIMPFALDKSVKCSNFIGEAMDTAAELGFENVLLIGHIGKLVKLGSGIMNTHSAQADGRMETLVTCGVIAGADNECLKKITECVTVDAALDILGEYGIMRETLDILAKRAEYYLNARVKNSPKTAAVMFSDKHGITVKTSAADELMNKIAEEYNG
ncbi:MAG: cobalt-precorrin-5B (C(1))-methyltransferase CbiD [Ruminococcus sp.]|nr:cobalt-precorrin-5B (C(1))-methyltransferase CbiD [Ruminococcus sp.]